MTDVSESSVGSKWLALAAAAMLIVVGMTLRISLVGGTLWVDEAESSINALTILDHGVPVSEYLGLPIYENTLTEPWPDHPEYEFRDSSYSSKGVAVYHGWLPLYAIAASQWLFGMEPDRATDPPRVLHGAADAPLRTIVPRIPALLFSLGTMIATFVLGCRLGGTPAGLATLALTALSARAELFGYQARYYSLTLFLSVVVALALWHVVRHGSWKSFVALGVAEGLLFHTHQFSALVFAITSLLAAPLIIRRSGWLPRSLLAAGIAAALILPWVWLSGFFETAAAVPKARSVFESAGDWVYYLLQRREPLIFGALIVAVVAGAHWLPARFRQGFLDHRLLYVFLLGWLAVGYTAFHFVVPAASFFYERLTLVLWTPFVLLAALFLADALRAVSIRWAPALAVIVVVVFLQSNHRIGFLGARSINALVHQPTMIASMAGVFNERSFPPGTRFYATPNNHLVWTYYLGLPVQSVAPVRRDFSENHPAPVVFIESQMDLPMIDRALLDEDAEAAGIDLDSPAGDELGDALWKHLAVTDLARRSLPTPTIVPLPDFAQRSLDRSLTASAAARGNVADQFWEMPVFRGLKFNQARDMWMAFYYRFVDPESRVGENQNIMSRMRSAEVVLVPRAGCVVFISAPQNPASR